MKSHDQESEHQEEKTFALWDLGSPLYDSYEVVSLSNLIERQLMTLPSLGGSKRVSKGSSSAPDDVVQVAPRVSSLFSSKDPKGSASSSASSSSSSSSSSTTTKVNALKEFVRSKLWRRRWRIGCRKYKPEKFYGFLKGSVFGIK